jgi:hypothetical protein
MPFPHFAALRARLPSLCQSDHNLALVINLRSRPAVVAGIMFFALRALFALTPAFSSRHPIKKWAALAALGACPPGSCRQEFSA